MNEIGSDTAPNNQSPDGAVAGDSAPTERGSGAHAVDASTTVHEHPMPILEVHLPRAAPTPGETLTAGHQCQLLGAPKFKDAGDGGIG